eukprot:COSAG06_NODE_57793_length_279_cov_0.577778_1_plen_25_part_01
MSGAAELVGAAEPSAFTAKLKRRHH